MEKKYECCFMGDDDSINSIKSLDDLDEYKDCCASDDEPRPEPLKNLRKFYNKKYLFRKSLKCKMQESGENITVILMNPSFADEYGLDETLSNVKKFLEQIGGFSRFEVLNIFPIRMPKSGNVKELMKKYDHPAGNYQEKNKRYIIETLKCSKKVLLSWGDNYHKEAQWIFDYLDGKELYVYRLNKGKGIPTHFSPKVYNKVAEKKLIKVTPYQDEKGVWYLKA